jgi:predicted short-subunit dehydrogenase-like oxidoreductase (DUF2520 family)
VAGALLDGGLLRGAEVVLHCGGGRAAGEALSALSGVVACGTLHPLVAVAGGEQAVRLIPRAYFAVEGDSEARLGAEAIAAAIGARTFELRGGAMTLYHAAAVIASNHPVALWHGALGLLRQAGIDDEVALEAMMALVRSAVENVASQGLPDALTGPVRRGDSASVLRHLEELTRHAPHLLDSYRACSVAAVATARRTRDGAVHEALLDALLEALARPINST